MTEELDMGFTRHLAEQKEYLKHPESDTEFNKPRVMSKEETLNFMRRERLFDYYGIVGFDCDGHDYVTKDDAIAVDCILYDKPVPADVEERLLQRKKDRILNNDYNRIEK